MMIAMFGPPSSSSGWDRRLRDYLVIGFSGQTANGSRRNSISSKKIELIGTKHQRRTRTYLMKYLIYMQTRYRLSEAIHYRPLTQEGRVMTERDIDKAKAFAAIFAGIAAIAAAAAPRRFCTP
jgi:hypothetical protein